MKFGIFVCILVVLAIHEAVSYNGPAALEGNCEPGDLPRRVLTKCHRVICEKKEIGGPSYISVPCPETHCEDGQETETGEEDLTKIHPHCCAPVKCI